MVGGSVHVGWDAAAATLSATDTVVAIDGPGILDWHTVLDGLSAALTARSVRHEIVRLDAHLARWTVIVERTSTPELAWDPDFARLAQVDLREFYSSLPEPRPAAGGILIVAGPGGALVDHDVVWYADLPKRFAEAAVRQGRARNLGQPETDGAGTTRRLFYIDWPVLDRHRAEIASRIDLWLDVQDPARPVSLDGPTLRRTAAALAIRPFRTRPTFNTAPWGGHWGQRVLGLGREQPNSAIGYELIAPESGVLIGDGDELAEVPFQLLVTLRPDEILGRGVHESFGTSFPIRFDYLDTVDGGNLSIHCHPQKDYMREIFGWPYTQHESYYVMVGGENGLIFLGLREDVDLDAFERDARTAVERGTPFRIADHVPVFPADQHRLFMIPAGTPHGSGEGNVVLEVSATPYLYSLRFYDWLRRDAEGAQRPVHVTHAFANLNRRRRGAAVAHDLIQEPRTLRSGDGWLEEVLGALPDVFYEVRRLGIDGDTVIDQQTEERFHVLNVVDGDGVLIETGRGDRHVLNYAETIVIPAAVGRYSVRRVGTDPVRVVKALVP